jgi:hypothetical protein
MLMEGTEGIETSGKAGAMEPETDCAAAFVMICTQISLSPLEAVTFSVVVVVSKLAGKPALKVTATLGTPLMSPALIGKATGW